jgi:large subunit ribosomal protein L15
MDIHSLPSIIKRSKKRLGLGHGSGRGKTGGRGTKGQNARSSRPLFFEGGAVPLTKRLPFLRGKNRNKPFSIKPLIINLDSLVGIPADKVIDIDALVSLKLVSVDAKKRGVKLLGNGTVKKAYTVNIPATKSAIEKITNAGGSVLS